jgi:two-component system CheB/CheR fusion protein
MKKTIAIKQQKETTVSKPVNQKISTSLSFPIVGIGASAGGLEALEQFFTNIPNDTGMAFIIIQHLDPNYVGMLPEILQRCTKMLVNQAEDYIGVKPDHVYVIPPNKSMSILHGYLHLFELTETRGMRLPIDIFFRSLADDQQEKSIGIILSGMGSDGSLGLKAIKEKNGLVLVQDPLSSKCNGMPNSAIASVIVDILAPANELPEKLVALLKFSPVIAEKLIIEETKPNFEKVVILLRTQTGHDFSFYKKTTLFRRIERRMGIHQIDKMDRYISFIQRNPKELDILFKELLIGVTKFFRDTEVWTMLKERVLPDLFNDLPNGYVLRVWVAGCSTGEEAYSFAMVFKEAYEKVKHEKKLTLQIFASDINKDAIEIARKGVYNSNIIADVSDERLSRFFTVNGTNLSVNTSIREMIVFAPHDITKDPPFIKLDFVLCRNLLIYMETELQKKLMNLFHYCLREGGVMLLGSAENINNKESLFSVIDTKLKFYKRSEAAIEIAKMDFPGIFSHSTKRLKEDIKTAKVPMNIQTYADQLVLQQFAPASVLINQEGDILYITGKTGKYIEPSAGKANMNIYAMARDGFRDELSFAIRKVILSYEPIILRNIKIGNNGASHLVDITFQSIEKPNAVKGTIMIVFEDVKVLEKDANIKSKTEKQTLNIREQKSQIKLQLTLEELQTTREEMHASQEELNSTNELLQTTNEELQSTNEELIASKVEMQCMNDELQQKLSEFEEANSDMQNLLNSTDIATLFLDKELNIRKFTDHLTSIIKLRPIDIGRPFTEVVSDLQYPDMADQAKKVLRTLVFNVSEIATNDNRWFSVRIMPYRRLDDKIDGLVITFMDITLAKQLEARLVAANTEEKEKRLAELVIANTELAVQNKEKERRAGELVIANKELIYQNGEKQKRAEELVIAYKELTFQNKEKEKHADELVIANKEKENLKAELAKTINILRENNLYKP